MTSTNDGKDVKSNQSSSSKGKSFYIQLYKSLDGRLSGEGDLRDRTQHLCEAWRRIHSLCQHSAPTTHPHLLSWLQRHTARTILQTEWQKPESKSHHGTLSDAIGAFIEESQKAIADRKGIGFSWEIQLLQRAEWFKNVLSNPWGHPILRLLSNPTGEKPSDKEVLDWLKEERGVMFVTRLRQLATAKTCVDIACALVAAVMDRVRTSVGDPEENTAAASNKKGRSFSDILKTEAGFTVDVWELLTDLEFVLLFKGENRSRCIELAKQTPLRSGYQLVERLHSRLEMSPREKKLWKNAKEVATLIAQVVIARCMVVPVCVGVTRTALYCCTRSLVRLLPFARLPTAANALAAPAATARHLHTLAAAVEAQSNDQMKPFVCELYVRAITTGMNELERLKLKVEKESEARCAEQTLSSWFTQLGTLLSKSRRLNYECALTAFSVHPSPTMYERILAAPDLPPQATSAEKHETMPESNSEFGSWATDSRTMTNFVKTSETLNIKQIQYNTNVLSTAVLSEGEAIGLGAELCQDLAVLLSGPRHKTLSWDMNRDILLENCKTYMDRTNGGTRALTTELKYLNLDPRSFQHLPEEEEDEDNIYYGIEKGYEHLVEFQEAEQLWQNAFSDSATEDAVSSSGFDEVTLPVRRKKKGVKKAKNFSDTEIDPLSTLVDDQQHEKKKERPHSKERSKERLQTRESEYGTEEMKPLRIISDRKMQNKARKERKKREKVYLCNEPKIGSLSRLIGMKVARVKNLPTQAEKREPPINRQTDNTSQRKLSTASLKSDSSDTNVVFDGVYSMDEIKSPEKCFQSYDKSHHKSAQLPLTDVTEEMEQETIDKHALRKTDAAQVQNITNNSHEALILSSSNTFNSFTDNRLDNKLSQSKHQNEDVKHNVKKLIAFRKLKCGLNKNARGHEKLHSYKNITTLHHGSLTKEVKGPVLVKPSLAIPNASKYTPNKSTCKQSASLKDDGSDSIDKGHMSNINSHPTERSYIGAVVTGLARYTNSIKENKEKDNDKQLSWCTETSKKGNKKTKENESFVEEKEVFVENISNNKQNVINDTNSVFQDFLRELKETINAGTITDTPEIQSTLRKHSNPVNKIMASSSNKNLKIHSAFVSHCAKPLVQQKRADVPNTFARLNYMHRNKQTDLRLRLPTNQSKLPEKPHSKFGLLSSNDKLNKFDYLQPKSNSTVSRVGNVVQNKKLNSYGAIQKNTNKKHTCFSNTLQTKAETTNNMVNKTQTGKELTNDTTKYQEQAASQISFLAEKDQHDLLLLLRQKNKLNAVKSDITSEFKLQHITQDSPLCSTENNSTFYSNLVSTSSKKLIDSERYKGKLPGTLDQLNNSLFELKQRKHNEIPTIPKKVNSSIDSILEAHTSLCKKNRVLKSESKTIGNKETHTHNFSTESATMKPNWESVMDALLKHKTPRRGPNALDVALNRDSFEQRSKENEISSQKDILINIVAKDREILKNDVLCQEVAPLGSTTPITFKSILKNSLKCEQKPIVVQKSGNDYLPKFNHPKILKKEIAYSVIDNADPFISGIPNSDYDLLEELMDDDLKKEIGELFSDEDAFSSVCMKKENESNTENKAKTIPSSFKKNYYDIATTNQAKAIEYQTGRSLGLRERDSQAIEDIKTVNTKKHSNNSICVIKQSLENNSNHKTPSGATDVEINKTEIPSHINVTEMPKMLHRQSHLQDNILYKSSTNRVFSNKRDEPSTKRNELDPKNCNKYIKQTVSTNNIFYKYHQNNNLICNNGVSDNTLQNVVVKAPEIAYDAYPTAEVTERTPNTSSCNSQPSTYVAVSTSIALLQSTHFATPVVNPVIIDKASIVSGSQKHSLQIIDFSTSINSGQPGTNNSIQSGISIIKQVPKIKHQHVSNLSFKSNSDTVIRENCQQIKTLDLFRSANKINTLIHFKQNKLSQIQEDFKSYEKVDRRLCPTINQTVENTGDDLQITKLERLKLKRLALTNRKISHKNDMSPIPLPYLPLKVIELSPKTSVESNMNINNDHIKHKNVKIKPSLDSGEVFSSRESIHSCIYNTDKPVPSLLSIEDQENCTENKSSKSLSRRINLRSMYKSGNDTVLYNKKNVTRKKERKVKSKFVPEKSLMVDNNQLDNVLSNNMNKIKSKVAGTLTIEHSNSKNAITQKNALIDRTENKDDAAINKLEIINRDDVDILEVENVITVVNNVESSTDAQLLDIEDKLSGSVMPKLNKPPSDIPPLKDIPMIIETNDNNVEKENLINKFQTDERGKLDPSPIKLSGHKEEINVQNNVVERAENHDVHGNKNMNEYYYIKNSPLQNSTDTNVTNKQISNTKKRVKHKTVMNQSKFITNFSPAKESIRHANYKLNQKLSTNKNVHLKNTNKILFKDITPKKTKNPNEKLFRIHLPNGKHVKATITASNNYNVNNILSHPDLKALLLNNTLKSGKCTFIKILGANRCVIDVNNEQPPFNNKSATDTTREIETINLVSDDEDEPELIPMSNFDRKRVYIQSLLGKEALVRHEKKLSGSCTVSLPRYTTEQMLALVKKQIIEEVTESEDINNVKVPVSTVPNNYEEHVNNSLTNGDVSSSENVTNSNTINSTENNTSSTLVHEESISVSHSLELKNPAAKVLPICNQSDEKTNEIKKEEKFVLDSIEVSKENSSNFKCYLKLTRCDNLVKQYEKLKVLKQECFVELVRCDNIYNENVNGTISSLHPDSSAESSVQNIDDSEDKNPVHYNYSENDETFNFRSDSCLPRSDSYSILNNFSEHSNVMYSFHEQMINDENHANYIDPNDKNKLIFINCDAEWAMTKRRIVDYIYNDKITVQLNNHDYDDISTTFRNDKECYAHAKRKCLKECVIETSTRIEVPSLKKLVLKIFENSNLIDMLQPLYCKNMLFKHNPTHCLKRKINCNESMLPSSCKIKKINRNVLDDGDLLMKNETKFLANATAKIVKSQNKISDSLLPTMEYKNNEIMQKNTEEFSGVTDLPEQINHFDTKIEYEYPKTNHFNETTRLKNKFHQIKDTFKDDPLINKINNAFEKHDLEDNKDYHDSQRLIENDSVTNMNINVSNAFDKHIMQQVDTPHMQILSTNTTSVRGNAQYKKDTFHKIDENVLESIVGDNNDQCLYSTEHDFKLDNNESSYKKSCLLGDKVNSMFLTDFKSTDNTFKNRQNEIITGSKLESEIILDQHVNKDSPERKKKFVCDVKETFNSTSELLGRQNNEVFSQETIEYDNTKIIKEMNSLTSSHLFEEARTLDKIKTCLDKIESNTNLSLKEAMSLNLDQDYTKITSLSDLNNRNDCITTKTKCSKISEFDESMTHSVTISNIEKDNIVDEQEQKTAYEVLRNVTFIYKDNSEVVLKGIEYEDPIAGTCYMFPLETSSAFSEEIVEDICTGLSTEDYDTKISLTKNEDNTLDDENYSIMKPKKTYSRFYQQNPNCYENFDKKAIKRKSTCHDFKKNEKKYRKSKNIDYLKNSASLQSDLTYHKEFKRLCDYYKTIKFSFSRSFHKEYIDVSSMIQRWPVQNTLFVPSHEEVANIFEDNYELKCFPDPTKQTLVEELSLNYSEVQSETLESNEPKFFMGFGEESGRVIQNLENQDVYPKFSAATLSDVKQSQPFLLSEDNADCENTYEISNFSSTKEDQKKKLKHYITYIQLRDKVRSFFKKTSLELKYSWIRDNLKDNDLKWKFNGKYDSTNNPFDFYIQDFIEPPPLEAIVQVVQVGQLPVSAAAQNPVSCDPRVTHVSDASPPQCSMENSLNDDSQSAIKTEYTELTTADLTLPLVAEYEHHEDKIKIESDENAYMSNNEITIHFENEFIPKVEPKEEKCEADDETDVNLENNSLQLISNNNEENPDYPYDENENTGQSENTASATLLFGSNSEQNGTFEKTDQIAHAMNAAGIIPTSENDSIPNSLVTTLSSKDKNDVANTNPGSEDFAKSSSINAIALQQALAHILPPSLIQTSNIEGDQKSQDTSVHQQVLHIIQSKHSAGNQITLVESGVVDNTQQSVINTTTATPVLHIIQNKSSASNTNSDESSLQHSNSFGGFSLVDTGLQQGTNQLLHIVNAGNQKANNTNQIIKRVNLLTNVTNAQGSNEHKMLQFVCKSADGKAIQLNASNQRSMVLRLQPIESQNMQSSPSKNDDHSPRPTTARQESSEDVETAITQQEIKSRSVYEENYAKFIQNTSNQQSSPESTTSLPKFNQAFGKPVFQDGHEKHSEINGNSPHLSSVNSDNSECETSDNAMNLDHIGQINSPPLLLRKSPQNSQSQPDLVQQIKQTISPLNIQTMHGGVIYTRQIPVNIGGGQTINLITVPTTELIDDSNQKQPDVKFVNHGDIVEPSIIKIVPPNQSTPNSELSHEDGNNGRPSGENGQSTQTQPILTQMRIKLPMLSKTPQMVTGARVVRPSFFQIQRNVIGGTNQPVYQQLVLTAAPPLGQQTIRLPQAQINRQVKVPTESSEAQMSTSTLEQLREFDMVLEQVKERSTVQPNSTTNSTTTTLHTSSADATDGASTGVAAEPTQVLYSLGTNQQFNVAYVNRKSTVTTSASSTFVRSPDSSGITDTPTTSTQVQLPQTVTTDTTANETKLVQQIPPKPKIASRSRSRPKASSNPPNTLKLNNIPPKTSSQKPLEDEQTTQRILYILAEYKEQVENSPDKDKPAPRRRTNPPTPGSSKRKKSHSRRPGARDMSPIHGDDTCRTMGSEDSSCGTSQGDCNENCLDSHSPQDSPRKVVKKLSFEQETPPTQQQQQQQQPQPQPSRNVIVADGPTITVARGTAGKPTTAVLMPANYILPVSVVKGGQQIAIVTNRGPKLLTVADSVGGTTNALLLQRLIGPAGLKPMLARPGVRHVRLPTSSLHNLQAFNLATATTVQPPDSTASPVPAPTPPDLIETKASASPWPERETQEIIKPVRAASPDGSEPWNVPSSADAHDYTYEETVRTDNLDRTVLEPIPDRYSPDMEAQRIFDKMFDVDSKKSYIVDSHDESPRCGYDIDASECDDKCYHQVVQKSISSQRQHRLTHVSAAALRHKYAILEHELRLQKSLSEECEDLGVDSPSASELFPEAELLFSGSPAHEQTQDHTTQRTHTPQPTILSQGIVPRPDIDDQIATDHLLQRNDIHDDNNDLDVNLGLDDVGIVTVTENGATITLDQEEFARSHPNTTFHSEEPIDDGEMQPYTITGIKGSHITSTIFHANRAPATVLMGPQTTVISQATHDNPTIQHNIKYSPQVDNIVNTPSTHQTNNLNLSSVLVKDEGLTRFDSILTDSRELHLSNTASAIVHSSHNATQVIRRVCYDDEKRESRYLMDEQDALIAGDDAKMIAEDSSRDATLESIAGDVDDYRSSPERHTELYWESNSTSERSEGRRPLDFSSDSDKCCKSPSYDETNSTDSSGVGAHMRLDSVIKDARGIDRSGSADGSSADDTHPPLRTYPAKRLYHSLDGNTGRSLTGKTRAGERSPDSLEIRRRASGRGVVKRCCHCCNGSPIPPRPKKPRQRKPAMDFSTH